MSNISSTQDGNTEFAGGRKLVVVTATPASTTGDTITFSAATHGITAIDAILACDIQSGIVPNCSSMSATYSGLVVTTSYYNQAGYAATSISGITIRLAVLGTI